MESSVSGNCGTCRGKKLPGLVQADFEEGSMVMEPGWMWIVQKGISKHFFLIVRELCQDCSFNLEAVRVNFEKKNEIEENLTPF